MKKRVERYTVDSSHGLPGRAVAAEWVVKRNGVDGRQKTSKMAYTRAHTQKAA